MSEFGFQSTRFGAYSEPRTGIHTDRDARIALRGAAELAALGLWTEALSVLQLVQAFGETRAPHDQAQRKAEAETAALEAEARTRGVARAQEILEVATSFNPQHQD